MGACLERSLELLVGMLGVLNAGAAYVPLELGYPLERQAHMMEDSERAVVRRIVRALSWSVGLA